jgi:(R,R)-butanediol dehydrogenase/meso-butanediol dehydrogenase/diacetyl reductase/L-iditol 2-dehydrogenase
VLPHLDLDELTQAVDLGDAQAGVETHLSGAYPKVVIRCNDLADEVVSA